MTAEPAAVRVENEHVIEHQSSADTPESHAPTESTLDKMPSPASSTKREGGWGRRIKRWFLGERAG